MPYFTMKQLCLFSSYQLNKKEEEKLNKFLVFLENSGVGELIHRECYKDHPKGGRPPYNYYNLFAASIYAFSRHPGTLRKIEDSFNATERANDERNKVMEQLRLLNL